MAGAARCSDCSLNWPKGITRCGVCLGDLDQFTYAEAMSVNEAKSLTAHAEFEREYKKRERGKHSRCGRPGPVTYELGDRKKTVDVGKEMLRHGVTSPEALGAAEARKEIPKLKEIRALESAYRS